MAVASRSRGLLQTLRWVRQRLRERPDSEHEIALNRFAIGTFLLLFVLIANEVAPDSGAAMLERTWLFFVVFYVVSVAIFVHLVAIPGISPVRRVFSAAHDIGMVAYAAAVCGPQVGFFYPVFLWAIFGNGFRFGLPYLHITMVISIVCFTAVLISTGFWQTNPGMSIALDLTLLILPLYASLLIRKLQEAKRQAEEASKAKSLFLASVSHELRTPLNAIIGFSDLLEDRNRNPREADMIGAIGRSGRLLLEMIDELLDFSRLEAGRMPSALAEVDLYDLVERVRNMLRVQADQKGIELGALIAADTPHRVIADGRHLEEILVNLASNALKFTGEGSVRLTLQTVSADETFTRLRFEVADTGIGVAEAAHDRIFESFTQADETIIDRFGGTGLGLSICKQLVEMMGGQIGLSSELGQGSTFWFEVSLERLVDETPAPSTDFDVLVVGRSDELFDLLADLAPHVRLTPEPDHRWRELADEAGRGTIAFVLAGKENGVGLALPGVAAIEVVPPGAETVALSELAAPFAGRLALPASADAVRRALQIARCRLGGSSGGGKPALEDIAARSLRVLVAEDNPTNQMVIEKILERAGHSVTIAENGEVAVDLLREGAFDLVLMDVNMPVMNGIEATKLYRFASLGQRRIPIIALTADATADARARCEEAGMDACATKPIEARQLLTLIAEITEEARPAEADGEDVVTLQAHPAFSAPDGATLKMATLHDLEELGGVQFVQELAEQFLVDAERLIAELSTAVERKNAAEFVTVAHALRSAAANVGVQSIFERCLAWRRTSPDELAVHGAERIAILRRELEKARALFCQHFDRAGNTRSVAV